MPSRSVLFVDDNTLLIELFRCYAMGNDDIDFCCAYNIEGALDLIESKNPAAIFLDNRLVPFNNFKETVPVLRQSGFHGKIIVISSYLGDPIFKEYQDHSVSGCIDKFDLNYNNFNEVINKAIA